MGIQALLGAVPLDEHIDTKGDAKKGVGLDKDWIQSTCGAGRPDFRS